MLEYCSILGRADILDTDKYIIPVDDIFVERLNKLKNDSKIITMIEAASKAPTMLQAYFFLPLWFFKDDVAKALMKHKMTSSKIRYVGRSELVKKGIKFPPSHPLDMTVYARHPVKNNVYITMAELHRVVFEHKVAEATRILMALGAKTIKVESIKGWNQEFSAKMDIAALKGNASINAKDSKSFIYEASYQPSGQPYLPDELAWYEFEESWQNIALGRLKHGLTNFSLAVTYEDDFGVNVNLQADVSELEASVGGNFEKHVSTIWRMDGSF